MLISKDFIDILYLSILFNFNLMFSKFCMSAKEPKGSQL